MGNCLGTSPGNEPIFFPGDDDLQHVTLGQDQPLIHGPVIWVSETPLTEGQLRGKRDTFWETAPAYDGRKEIWDALKVAAEAAEEEDYDLAQAILTGANISLPTGRLTEVYDELGTRYVIPNYCLNRPTNMQDQENFKTTSQTQNITGEQLTLKIRLSTLGKDVKITVNPNDTVLHVKHKLHELHNVDATKIRMLYSGTVLADSIVVGQLKIPRGFVIQAFVG